MLKLNLWVLFVTDDTDFSESESAQISKLNIRSPTSVTSETEEESRDGKSFEKINLFSIYVVPTNLKYLHFLFLFYFIEPQVLRIETKQAPRPSQPEVVLSDGKLFFCFYQVVIVE